MKELIEGIARHLVDEPDLVEVGSKTTEGVTVLELKVAPGDVGKVIGRQGRTARSLRAILGAAAAKHHRRCSLDIAE